MVKMYKVIFVDDEPWAVIDIMHTISWEQSGFSVAGYYEKPREAFRYIIENQPDLVFTDIRMPVWDGFELIRQCREAGSEAEFVILSSYSDFVLAKQAIRSAVLDYCLKPVNPEVLVKLLGELRLILDDKRIALESSYASEGEAPPGGPESPEHFDGILAFIRKNYQNKLLLTQLAERFNFNKNYICYLFKKYTNGTFTAYLTGVRINEAKRLLRSSGLSQGEIAEKTGFMDYYYFNKVFKSECGVTPYQYRKGHSAREGGPEHE